jgi:hypothetical protein
MRQTRTHTYQGESLFGLSRQISSTSYAKSRSNGQGRAAADRFGAIAAARLIAINKAKLPSRISIIEDPRERKTAQAGLLFRDRPGGSEVLRTRVGRQARGPVRGFPGSEAVSRESLAGTKVGRVNIGHAAEECTESGVGDGPTSRDKMHWRIEMRPGVLAH